MDSDDLYRLSIYLGLTPLVVGTVIFALWYLTRGPLLIAAGLLTIFGGVYLALIALGCLGLALAVWCWRGVSWSFLLKKGFLSSALILSNIPACLLIVTLADHVRSTFHLELRNENRAPIERFAFHGPDMDKTWKRVAPGASRSFSAHFAEEGTLTYTARVDTARFEGTAVRQASDGQGGM